MPTYHFYCADCGHQRLEHTHAEPIPGACLVVLSSQKELKRGRYVVCPCSAFAEVPNARPR